MQARRAEVLRRGLPYLVALKDGEVVGYAYASPYRARSAYRHTVEDSIYVAEGLHGHGIGKALLRTVIARCTDGGFTQMVAVVGNERQRRFAAPARKPWLRDGRRAATSASSSGSGSIPC